MLQRAVSAVADMLQRAVSAVADMLQRAVSAVADMLQRAVSVDATRRRHEYLLVDLSQDTDDRFRFRTCIFPSVYRPTIYTDIDDKTDKVELSRSSRTHVSPTKIT